MRNVRARHRAVISLVTLGLLAACGSAEPPVMEEPEHPILAPYWRDFFEAERDYAEQRDDHFVMSVLEDDWVTDEEWSGAACQP